MKTKDKVYTYIIALRFDEKHNVGLFEKFTGTQKEFNKYLDDLKKCGVPLKQYIKITKRNEKFYKKLFTNNLYRDII